MVCLCHLDTQLWTVVTDFCFLKWKVNIFVLKLYLLSYATCLKYHWLSSNFLTIEGRHGGSWGIRLRSVVVFLKMPSRQVILYLFKLTSLWPSSPLLFDSSKPLITNLTPRMAHLFWLNSATLDQSKMSSLYLRPWHLGHLDG